MAQLFDTTFRALEFATAGTQMRHHVITSNLANVDTPKYKSLDLEFQQLENKSFALEVKMTHQKRAEQARNRFGTHLLAESTTEERLDRNNVDVDKEMAKLIENSYFHRAYLELANRKFRLLKSAISGRV